MTLNENMFYIAYGLNKQCLFREYSTKVNINSDENLKASWPNRETLQD